MVNPMRRIPDTWRALLLVPLLAVAIDLARATLACGPGAETCLEAAGRGWLGSAGVALLLVYAAGLAAPRTRPAAGLLSAGLLVAVWPANLQMALDAWRDQRGTAYRVLTLARLPLQLPMIRTALRAR